jgi:hypothetical protein
MQNYYKEPIYRMIPAPEFYVSLINKISINTKFAFQTQYPAKKILQKKLLKKIIKNLKSPEKILADPTRRIKKAFNVQVFGRQEIEMHHMSFVRINVVHKIKNSSGRDLFKNMEEQIINLHESFKINNSNQNIKVVENIFAIDIKNSLNLSST